MFKGKRKEWLGRGAIVGVVAFYLALTMGLSRPTLPQLLGFHQNEAHAAPSQSVLPATGASTYLSSQADYTGWPWDIPGFQVSYNASLTLIDAAVAALQTASTGNTTLTASSASSFSAALAPGACATATPAVVGATTAMVAVSDPVTYPGDAFSWSSYVSSSGVVSVRLCNHTGATATATASVYRIRVLK